LLPLRSLSINAGTGQLIGQLVAETAAAAQVAVDRVDEALGACGEARRLRLLRLLRSLRGLGADTSLGLSVLEAKGAAAAQIAVDRVGEARGTSSEADGLLLGGRKGVDADSHGGNCNDSSDELHFESWRERRMRKKVEEDFVLVGR
jgi:hypothetical protein